MVQSIRTDCYFYGHQNNGGPCSYGTDHIHYKRGFHLQEKKTDMWKVKYCNNCNVGHSVVARSHNWYWSNTLLFWKVTALFKNHVNIKTEGTYSKIAKCCVGSWWCLVFRDKNKIILAFYPIATLYLYCMQSLFKQQMTESALCSQKLLKTRWVRQDPKQLLIRSSFLGPFTII